MFRVCRVLFLAPLNFSMVFNWDKMLQDLDLYGSEDLPAVSKQATKNHFNWFHKDFLQASWVPAGTGLSKETSPSGLVGERQRPGEAAVSASSQTAQRRGPEATNPKCRRTREPPGRSGSVSCTPSEPRQSGAGRRVEIATGWKREETETHCAGHFLSPRLKG